MHAAEPSLSVVVACVNAEKTFPSWLAAFEPQARRRSAELLVAAAGDGSWLRSLQRTYPFELVTGEAGALVPSLWGLAMPRARGRIVAVTISACRPSENWLDAICDAREWQMHGVFNCGKGQPVQAAKMMHGAAPARFRKIRVGY